MKKKIIPHLWYDTEAKKAAELYASTLPNSKVTGTTVLTDTPSGDTEIVTMNLMGQDFMSMSAGPLFKFNPSTSFLVSLKNKEEVVRLWDKLIDGGSALMELGEYPFSEKYGWLADKYGLSWQLMHAGDMPIVQNITPTLLFVGEKAGKAEEAIKFYVAVFKDARLGDAMRYEKGEDPDKEGTIKHATFTLEGYQFAAMDSAKEHNFDFNEAISFIVKCDTQDEIDYYWGKLSAVPESEQCGWLKDKYGVSWQIVPTAMDRMMGTKDEAALQRVTQALLAMKKLDVAELEAAYNG